MLSDRTLIRLVLLRMLLVTLEMNLLLSFPLIHAIITIMKTDFCLFPDVHLLDKIESFI